MENIVNPFIIKGYVSKEYFCDRKNELETLHRNVKNGSNTTIISPRKMGKSRLIFRFFDDLTTKIQSVYQIYDLFLSRWLEVKY